MYESTRLVYSTNPKDYERQDYLIEKFQSFGDQSWGCNNTGVVVTDELGTTQQNMIIRSLSNEGSLTRVNENVENSGQYFSQMNDDNIYVFPQNQLKKFDSTLYNEIQNVSTQPETSINTLLVQLVTQAKEIALLSIVNTKIACPICLEADANTNLIPCNHTAHANCLIRWVRMQQTCPVCRDCVNSLEPVSMQQKHEEEEEDGWGWFTELDEGIEPYWEGSDYDDRSQPNTSPIAQPTSEVSLSPRRIVCAHVVTSPREGRKTFGPPPVENLHSIDDQSIMKFHVSSSISITRFRIVEKPNGGDRHAEYLIEFTLGNQKYNKWKRHSEVDIFMKKLNKQHDYKYSFPRTVCAWRNVQKRTQWFDNLNLEYLHKKCIAMDRFVRSMLYESMHPRTILEFLVPENVV